jgi:hypothetical protein
VSALGTRLGETFEFHRSSFNRESLPAASAALVELYALLDVPPVAARVMHDGISPIVVGAGEWRTQHAELWQALVPSKGAAQTVQGELIRISGRIADQVERNGAAHWDDHYRAMTRAFVALVATGFALSDADLLVVREAVRGKPADYVCEDLMRLAVRWVQRNPTPVALPPPSYER